MLCTIRDAQSGVNPFPITSNVKLHVVVYRKRNFGDHGTPGVIGFGRPFVLQFNAGIRQHMQSNQGISASPPAGVQPPVHRSSKLCLFDLI